MTAERARGTELGIEAVDPLALPADLARFRCGEPSQRAQKRGLAGPVGARHDQRLSRADAEGKPVEKPRKTTTCREFLGFEHGMAIIAEPLGHPLRDIKTPLLSCRSPTVREHPMPDQEIRAASLEYHRQPPPGKISVQPTKHLTNQRDLALAYTPGVAAACDEIVRDPAEARNLTARGNLVGVVTNGTAVLGLGAIGPLAAKPVMEGKAVLFKKFAGIDCFDIEI